MQFVVFDHSDASVASLFASGVDFPDWERLEKRLLEELKARDNAS